MKKLLGIILMLVALTGSSFATTFDSTKVTQSGANAQTYTNACIIIGYQGGSGYAKLVLLLRSGTEAYVRADSDITFLASPDTLFCFRAGSTTATGNFDWTKSYSFRVVITDGSTTDTSVVTDINPIPYPWPDDWDYVKSNRTAKNDVLKGGGTYTQSNFVYYSNAVWLGPYHKLRAWATLFGLDNNHTFDSATVYLETFKYGAWVRFDSLVNRDIDTVHTVPKLWAWEDSTNVATNFTRLIGDSLRAKVDITDSSAVAGDTMDTDMRGFYYWLELIK